MTQTVPPPQTAPAPSPTWRRVAQTRPRVRRDVLCTDTGNGAVFHNAQGGFALTGRSAYRFATVLVPRLDGTASVEELCDGLPDGQRAMIANLVATLYDRGFARDVEPGSDGPGGLEPAVAERFAAQLAYVDHYVGDAAGRFERFRTARVAVLGDDEVARWAALSLVRNGAGSVALTVSDPALTAELAGLSAAGCPVAVTTPGDLGSYDVLVVTPSPDGPARLLDLLRTGLPAGLTVLPAWTLGPRVVVGPSTVAGVAGCWACAALRLGSAADPAAAARLWSSIALGAGDPGTPLRGPLAAMVGNLLGYEVFRLRTGVLPVETSGRVLVQDTASLDVTAQPLLPDPRCPFCAAAPEPALDRDAVLAWRPAVLPADPSDDADDVLAELEARSVLVQPDAGPFLRYADESVTQLPLKVGTVEVAVGPGEVRTVTAYDVRHVAGARLRALETAATLYTDHTVPLAVTDAGAARAARPDDPPAAGGPVAGGPAAGPDGAPAGGDPTSAAGSGRRVEPGRLGTASGVPGEVSAWVPAESLLSGEAVLVPAAAARPYGPANVAGLVTRTPAGLGAASTPAGAVVAGLLSALAFAALDRALRRQGDVSRVDLAVADPQLTFLVRSADTLGVELELLELAAPVPVLLARTGAGPLWAVAAATEWTAAAVAAVRDLLGQVQLPGADRGDPLLADLDPAALVPTGDAPAAPDRAVDVPELLDRLRADGTDVLAVPSGAADLRAGGLHVARVLLEAARAD